MYDSNKTNKFCSSPQTGNVVISVVVLQRTTRNCCKMHAARAARLFFLVQPIRFLIYAVNVDVVVDVVDAEAHKYPV